MLLSGLLTEQNALPRALAACERALALAPGLPAAQRERATLLYRLGRLEEAAEALGDILRQAPGTPDVAASLGAVLFQLGRFDDAAAVLEPAARQSRHPMLLKNLAATRRARADYDGAEAAYRAAIAADPNFAEAQRDLALLRLLRGDVPGAFAAYEWRFKTPLRGEPPLPTPRWDGSAAPDRSLLLHFEQGLGDTIQFLRFVPLAAARVGHLFLCLPPPLRALAQGMSGVELVPSGARMLRHDLHAYLMSLPHLLGLPAEQLGMAAPYLAAPAERIAAWRARLGSLPGRRVGIALAGSPAHEQDGQRSLPPAAIARLACLPGVTLIHLRPEPPPHPAMHDVADGLTDFAETAAAAHACDLILSVDTALCHLAGALGLPVWTMLPHVPDWRWGLQGNATPWYPSMRLFRQHNMADWNSVVDDVAKALN